LAARPGIEIISRDRGERYATEGRAGSPDALHIADPWHLIRNWAEVVERVLKRHHKLLRQVQLVKPLPEGSTAAAILPPKSVNRRRHYADRRRDQAQREREKRWTTSRTRTLADVPNGIHRYEVMATDAAGNRSPRSARVAVTVASP
jgi:transposase